MLCRARPGGRLCEVDDGCCSPEDLPGPLFVASELLLYRALPSDNSPCIGWSCTAALLARECEDEIVGYLLSPERRSITGGCGHNGPRADSVWDTCRAAAIAGYVRVDRKLDVLANGYGEEIAGWDGEEEDVGWRLAVLLV